MDIIAIKLKSMFLTYFFFCSTNIKSRYIKRKFRMKSSLVCDNLRHEVKSLPCIFLVTA